MEYYKHTAEKGDVGAMVQLGKLYYHGSQGVPQDLVGAVRFFIFIVLCHMVSIDMYIYIYIHTHIYIYIYIDLLRTVRFCIIGRFDIVGCVSTLSARHSLTQTPPSAPNPTPTPNQTEAARFFEQAARAGEPSAMGSVGHMYMLGLGVRQSNDTARHYFVQGQERGWVCCGGVEYRVCSCVCVCYTPIPIPIHITSKHHHTP